MNLIPSTNRPTGKLMVLIVWGHPVQWSFSTA